jgi:hypothetical protein
LRNRETHEANHNGREVGDLLASFRAERDSLVRRLGELDESTWGNAAFQLQLGRPMRIVDVVCMVGEHDDYHLARVRQLSRARTTT